MVDFPLDMSMSPEEMERTGVNKLTDDERAHLAAWGSRMFSLGMHRIEDIAEIKYGGRRVELSDGSRWEVNDLDADTVEFWGEMAKVLVADGEMYLLNECEKAEVEEDFD